tara:strand:+ start:17904 stop:21374 length:3471 start_codon:yes stop_codon:yes gene_type:complete
MAQESFIHLRTHSSYSLSEGAIKVEKLVELAADKRMPALAITDRGNLFGALEFSDLAKESGVQPILGIEIALTAPEVFKKSLSHKNLSHIFSSGWLVLLAQNSDGWNNMMSLSSIAYLETPENEIPQVSLDDINDHSEGIIAFSGGTDGPIGNLLRSNELASAKELLANLNDIYKDRFYIEIMRHETQDQVETEPEFLSLARDFNIPLVATNDVYYATSEMYEAHDALMCIAQGAHIDQADRRRLTQNNYFKDTEEMRNLFEDIPEAFNNTSVIAQRCAFGVPSRDPILPIFDLPEGQTEKLELTQKATKGLEKRLQQQVFVESMDEAEREVASKPYRKRLENELNIISSMNFPGYFLIVADFIGWAKSEGIPVGPGRGSGAGSLVAWALNITDLDPLRFGLLFERFLNPERVSMPDFDIDFCRNRRDEVIEYVCSRYGKDKVAQIITFGKLEARAVIRDVGRVLGLPYGQVDRISKLIPFNPANPVKLSDAILAEPLLKSMQEDDPAVERLIAIALKLEGLHRHASTHAAGLVISDRPLNELVPLYRDPRSNMPVTQFSMKFSEQSGLVKFDFLGLKTLTVIEEACQNIRRSGIEVILSEIPFNDKKTFDLLSSGHTAGVFQLESAGMRDVLRGLKPDTFEDIIALVALYRPGPMDNIPKYVARKHGKEKPDYLHEKLVETLRETYGVIIYQEQVMEIARLLSGYSLGAADLLRRAMGKKIQSEMDSQREVFVNGAVENDVDKDQANEIFDLVSRFAGYGFNKSHAAAYALVAYQTAFLKANYPVEFMAATMTLELNNTDKLGALKQELDRLGIHLLPPDINLSSSNFTVEKTSEGSSAVRYALGAIKNVGEQAMNGVESERNENGKFRDIFDLATRLDPQSINKRQLENLAKAGAFDDLCNNRRQVFNAADLLMRHSETSRRDVNQASLFDNADSSTIPNLELPSSSEWRTIEKLQFEQEAIGFFLSAHPLDDSKEVLKKIGVTPFSSLVDDALRESTKRIAGVVLAVQERSNADSKFAFVRLSDPTASFEIAFFREVYNSSRELLLPGKTLMVNVNVRKDGEQLRITAEKAVDFADIISKQKMSLIIEIASSEAIEQLFSVLEREGKGNTCVSIIVNLPSQDIEIELPGIYSLPPNVQKEIVNFPGVTNVVSS